MKLIKKIKIDKKNFNLNNKNIIVIQGLGFVGSVMSLLCAISTKNFVFGIDLPKYHTKKKINLLNKGKFPFKCEDLKIQNILKKVVKQKNYFNTSSVIPYSIANIIVIDINLDVKKKNNELNQFIDFDVNLKNFKESIVQIGRYCREDVLIILESTVPPGTTEKIVKPIIYEELKNRGLATSKIKISHSYERVMPGKNYINSIKNYYRVYSGIDKKSAISTKKFLSTIINVKKYPLTELNTPTESEIAKILENSYRATNIAFMVEWTKFSEITRTNIYNIVKAIRKRETHKNIMLPGIGVGGYCLPKDPLLAQWSLKNLFKSNEKLNFSIKSIKTNDQMPLYAYKFSIKILKKFKIKKITLMGCAYTGDVGDTRYSPVEYFYKFLKKNNYLINIYDPYVDYWKENKITSITKNKFYELDCDAIILCTGHQKFKGNRYFLKKLIEKKNLVIIDLVGILKDNEINRLKKKHHIKILGRGDI